MSQGSPKHVALEIESLENTHLQDQIFFRSTRSIFSIFQPNLVPLNEPGPNCAGRVAQQAPSPTQTTPPSAPRPPPPPPPAPPSPAQSHAAPQPRPRPCRVPKGRCRPRALYCPTGRGGLSRLTWRPRPSFRLLFPLSIWGVQLELSPPRLPHCGVFY